MNRIKSFFKTNTVKMEKNDYIILGIIILLYSILSFYKLGSFTNPSTFIVNEDNDKKEIVLKVSGESLGITKMRYFNGIKPGSYNVLVSKDNKEYKLIGQTNPDAYVFGWYDLDIIDNKDINYLKLVLNTTEGSLGEISLDGGVSLISISKDSESLVDEQDIVPEKISYYNSTYFDEVYFARAAYEYANDLPTLEWVHPPFGKLVQSIPIYFLGMNPFSYRLVGNIAGILLVAVMYLFAKALFKNRTYATVAALLMALDGFHFAQTRMGTIDSQLVLYILLSFYFMYKYLDMTKTELVKKKIIYLSLSGLFISFAIATKWTGLFAGLGLFILFTGHFMYYYFIHKKPFLNKKNLRKIIYTCIITFIITPIIIYTLCYFVKPNVSVYKVNSISSLTKITGSMYDYHSTLDATHPFSSNWYSWPLSLKPVWLYSNDLENGMKETISAVGNMVVWVGSLLGIAACVYFSVKKDKRAIVLLVGFLCLFIPYLQIDRCMFLYHYFPSLPFAMLGLTLLLKKIVDKTNKKWIPWLFILLVLIWFIIYFPIVSGTPVAKTVVEKLKIFPEWYF